MKKLLTLALLFTLIFSMLLISCDNSTNSTNSTNESNESGEQEETLKFPDASSEGFQISEKDDQTCVITGITTCADTMIRIPETVNGLKVTGICVTAGWQRKEPIKGIMIPDSVTEITFLENCYSWKLEEIILPDTPIKIGKEVFSITPYVSNEKNWTDGALYIGNHLISTKSGLGDTFVVRDGTLDIATNAFYESTVNHVVIPDSVVIINDSAFIRSENLNRLTIGKGIRYIGDDAFYGCDALDTIAYAGTEDEWENIEKGNAYSGYSNKYNLIYNWSDEEQETPDVSGTTDPKYFTFELNDDNASYKVKVNKDYIGAVTEYHIPMEYEGLPVTKVGSFAGIDSIKTITLPDSVISVDEGAFGWNYNLTTVKLSANLTVLPENLFTACEKLTSIAIPSSVTQIVSNAFCGCVALSEVRFEGTVAQWNSVEKGEWWYSGAYGEELLKNVTCSDGIGELYSNDIIENEPSDDVPDLVIDESDFENVTIDITADSVENITSGLGFAVTQSTVEIEDGMIEVSGYIAMDIEEMEAYRTLFVGFICELAKDLDNFLYDDANDLYLAKETISFDIPDLSPAPYTGATITATDVTIQLDEENRIREITLDMEQEISEGDISYTIVVMEAVLTLSEYGTTVR